MSKYQNKTILLVEDEYIIASSEKISLEKFGFNVILASSGEEAIEIYSKNSSISLVLLDINLGAGIDGTEAAVKMLENREIPIIFLSSHTETEVVEKTEGITSYGYIVKNTSEALLNASIRMAFRLFESKQKEREKDFQLSESESKVRHIFNSIDDAIFIFPFTKNGFEKFEEVNETACKRYGYTHDEFLNMSVIDITKEILNKDGNPIDCKNLLKDEKRIKFEAIHLTKKGKEIPVDITSTLIELKGRRMILSTARDISDYKKHEEEKLLYEEGYHNLIEGINEPVWIIDLNSDLVDVNKKACEALGYTKEELLKAGLYVIDKSLTKEAIDHLVTTLPEDKVQIFETSHETKDGRILPVEIYSNMVSYKSKKAILSVSRDISKQKMAEEALIENEKMLAAALQGSISGTWEIDIKTMKIKYDKNWLNYIGYNETMPENLNDICDTLYPKNSKEVKQMINACISYDKPFYESKNHLRKKNGEYIWVLCRGKIIERDNKGNPTKFAGINIDITERELEEQQVKEYEAQFKAIFEISQSAIIVFDDDGHIIMANNSAAKIFEMSIDNLTGMVITDLSLETIEDKKHLLKEYNKTGYQKSEITVINSNNKKFNIYYNIVKVRKDFNLSILTDITELKTIHEKLEISQEKYKALYENAPIPYQSLDKDGKFNDINPAWLNITGYKIKNVIGKPFTDFISPENKNFFSKGFSNYRKEGYINNVQLKLKHKDGHYIDIVMNGRIGYDLEGNFLQTYCIFQDITEQKRATEKLMESESKYRQLFETASDMIFLIEKDGKFLEVNKTGCEFIGVKKEDIQKYFIRKINPKLTEKAIRDFWKNIPYEKPLTFYESIKRHDNKIIPVETIVTKFKINDNIYYYGICRDITERKENEEELKRQLKEKEALLIAVHHRIKNNIASISGLLSLQANSTKSVETQKALQDAMGRVNCMKFLYESLLVTKNFNGVSVKRYFENIIDSIFTVFPDNKNLKVEKNIEDFTIEEKKLFPLGVILEELITNTIKYAFASQKNPKLKISFKKNNNFITFKIQDNGIGVPKDFLENEGEKFGMMIVRILSEQLKAEFKIENKKGTICTIKFPI